MSSSLRFALLLSGIGALATPVAIYVIERQDMQQARTTAEQMTGGHVDAGKAAIQRYGCGACHQIQGISGADGKVGPSLNGIALRTEIAGRLPNQPDKLILWLRHPQQVVPGNGMPDQGVTPRDAQDMAAYLYTLRK
jgi:cytochrome c